MFHHIGARVARRRSAICLIVQEPGGGARVLVGTDPKVDSTGGTQGGILMKRTWLATVAAAALVAGTIAVSAQGGGAGGAGGGGAGGAGMGGGGTGGGGAPSAAPAEKMDRGSGGRTTGQGTGSQMDRGSSGQTQMDRGQGQGEHTGQGAGERGQSGTTQNRDQTQPRTGQGEGAQKGQTGQTNQQSGQGGQKGQQTGQGQTSTGSASLNTEQRTKIRETVLKGGNVNRVSNVNFNINVGTVVPRSVHLVAVPSTIVEVHPAWRGFMYFVVNDEIIIVEPGTLRIVAVIS